MIFERIESKGLAHYSYLIGDDGEAIVIDPRRDCNIYLEMASKKGLRISNILETHRNEDYVICSLELADRTNAEIWHADSQLNYQYGNPVENRQTWKIGGLKLEAIHTPGHTLGHMSYLLYDQTGEPWIVFTGDSLFAGDVGRVDLMGMDHAEEMTDKLYDTIFNKLLPLGDEVIVCPAHGSGSVCGSSIADRVWTTIGIERQRNPKLQYSNRNEFIEKIAKKLERPPYFREMERLNLEGPPILGNLPVPTPLSPDEFKEKAKKATVLDTRMELGFNSAHVPGALSIWIDGLPNFAGWFLSYEEPILLVNETNDPTQATRYLTRIGSDNLAGYLSGGMLSWHTAGKTSNSIETITVHELCHLLDEGKPAWILDVRNDEEVEKEKIPDAHHIHITQLPNNLNKIPKNQTINIFCGSGLRSTIATSFLKQRGWEDIKVVLGGTAGWKSKTCPIE